MSSTDRRDGATPIGTRARSARPGAYALRGQHGRPKPTRDTRLRSIADLLGCDLVALSSDTARRADRDSLAQANELITLWLAITNPRDRSQLLTYARDLASG